MTSILRGVGNTYEPFAILMGVVCILTSVIFFLQKFEFISLSIEIPDLTLLYFFAGLGFLSGIVHLLASLGFIGTK